MVMHHLYPSLEKKGYPGSVAEKHVVMHLDQIYISITGRIIKSLNHVVQCSKMPLVPNSMQH